MAENEKARKPEWFDALIFDINGIARVLRAPKSRMDAIMRDGVTFPFSVFAMRYDGAAVEETGIALAKGDPDGACFPLEGTLSETPWRPGGMQAVFAMRREGGGAHFADPRGVLAAVARRFADNGLRPALAAELEFYLSSADMPLTKPAMPELYSPEPLSRHSEFLDLLAEAMSAAGIRGGFVVSEYGGGQLELNFEHTGPERACLEGALFRYLARRCAETCGMRATFLAKPRAGASGSGMHFHFSAAAEGGHLFADDEKLKNAIAGALAIANEAMAFFAPFANSYRRIMPGGYAPAAPTWGSENRAAAVRIPMAKTAPEKRFEFRIAGADANPFLAAAAILAGAHWGLQNKTAPPPEQKGKSEKAALPLTWRAALDELARAKILPAYLGAEFISHYQTVKESEWHHHRDHISDYDRNFYAAVI